MIFRTLLCLIFLIPASAWAKEGGGLTEQSIKAFIERTKDISMGKDETMMQQDIFEYLDQHIHTNATFKSNTTFQIPGQPIQETPMKLNKDEYIAHVLDGQDLLKGYDATISIVKLDIARNGKTATLETSSAERGRMSWPDGKGGEEAIPIEGASLCTQKLELTESNEIVMMNADCKTLISFAPFSAPLGE